MMIAPDPAARPSANVAVATAEVRDRRLDPHAMATGQRRHEKLRRAPCSVPSIQESCEDEC